MPYTSKKTGKNKITVMKKDTGEVVGHTTPEKYNAYMAALHIHSGDNASKGGIVSPIPSNKQMRKETEDGGAQVESDDKEFEKIPHLDEGALIGDPSQFDVNGGSSDTFKGLSPTGELASAPSPTQFPDIPLPSQLPNPSTTTLTGVPSFPQLNPINPTPAASGGAKTPPATSRALPGMPPSVGVDDIQPYLAQNKAKLEEYGPEQQMAVANSLLKARTGLGGSLAQAGGGLADAIMQGVARAGNPGFQKGIQEQGAAVTGEKLGAMQKANEAAGAQVGTEMKMDEMNPNSPSSKAAQQSIGAVLIQMGYSKAAVAKMSAAQILSTADVSLKFEDIQTQEALKEATLKYQQQMGMATIGNQQAERKLQMAGLKAAHPFLLHGLDLGGGAGAQPTTIESEEQYNSLPTGSKYSFNGKVGTKR